MKSRLGGRPVFGGPGRDKLAPLSVCPLRDVIASAGPQGNANTGELVTPYAAWAASNVEAEIAAEVAPHATGYGLAAGMDARLARGADEQ